MCVLLLQTMRYNFERDEKEVYVKNDPTLFQALPFVLRLGTLVSRSKVLIFITLTGSCFSRPTPGTNPACTTIVSPMPGIRPSFKMTGQDAKYWICFLVKDLASS